jgi:hypothetical protein
MFVTGTVWFRKFLTTSGIVVFYTIVAFLSTRDCLAPAEYKAEMSGTNNTFPYFILMPDFDSFKYNFSCTTARETSNLAVQIVVVVGGYALNNYVAYVWELAKRRKFAQLHPVKPKTS